MNQVQNFILIAPVLLFSMVAHEYAHGYAALKNGDMTAYQLGRLTWNPAKHIDPFMTIVLPVMLALSHAPILGGAKPVPVNPRNYRNFKKGDIVVSLAGIVANLVIAVLCVPLIVIVYAIGARVGILSSAAAIFQRMLLFGILLNVQLAAFNLLPIPPLDGSHVMKYLLPPAWGLAYQRVGRYGLVVLILFLYVGTPLLSLWLGPARALIGALSSVAVPYLLPLRSQWTV